MTGASGGPSGWEKGVWSCHAAVTVAEIHLTQLPLLSKNPYPILVRCRLLVILSHVPESEVCVPVGQT